ncbi:sodium-coupled monocarboxylate transporter 1-like [Condylostylus longicornis]|uniref:sodium-coupled monocarboxylate transporter 1-like n=1 Tax=Condylostylus longicornis TaxID=2530218 RepID=UPI00244DB96B|nr:sodium-coupled monocarboxylate transporter 1-like [Condylostylus longicornis]
MHSIKNLTLIRTDDFFLFGLMLTISAAIGVYFGFIQKGENTAEEYLMGGRKMKSIPIAVSLISSQMSAIAIMTIPIETYLYGMQYYTMLLSILLVLPILLYIIVPIFYNNNISNCYKYLELRFDKRTREIVTMTFLLKIFLLIPIYIFVPSLAFSQVTGINIHLINGVVCSICIFYTMLGGIKAVVWTDVIQATIMLFSVFLVAISAIYKVGGIKEVIERAEAGSRLYMSNFTIDLTTRTTVWNTLLGGTALWISHIGVHQSCVQRIVSLPSLAQSRKSLIIFALGFFLIMSLNSFTGIIMYARYYLCDPIKAGIVEKQDKLLPFFIQDTIGHIKGMPGIFISCVFSAGLSTVSANFNTVAGIIYFDYISPSIKSTDVDLKANFYMKLIVVVCGIYCILAGFVVEKFGSIFQMTLTISGISQGAVAGTFLLGMLVPIANAKGAFYGIVGSVTIVGFIALGTQYHALKGHIKYQPLPVRLDGCKNEFNFTLTNHQIFSINDVANSSIPENIFILHKVSFYWYVFFGCVLVWLIAIPFSVICKDKKSKININLFSPAIQKWIPNNMLSNQEQNIIEDEHLLRNKNLRIVQ